MTDKEIVLVAVGIIIGITIMVLVDAILAWRENRVESKTVILADYDRSNPINQARKWEPFEFDGMTLYRLQ